MAEAEQALAGVEEEIVNMSSDDEFEGFNSTEVNIEISGLKAEIAGLKEEVEGQAAVICGLRKQLAGKTKQLEAKENDNKTLQRKNSVQAQQLMGLKKCVVCKEEMDRPRIICNVCIVRFDSQTTALHNCNDT